MQLCVCLDKKKKKKKRSSGGGRELQCCGGLAAMSSSMVCKVLLSILIVYVAGGFRVAYVLSASSDDSSDSDAAFGFNQFSTNIGHVVLLGDAQVSNDDLALELFSTHQFGCWILQLKRRYLSPRVSSSPLSAPTLPVAEWSRMETDWLSPLRRRTRQSGAQGHGSACCKLLPVR
jgi:hypothetical protein